MRLPAPLLLLCGFLATIPFAYAAQVVTRNPLAAAVPFAILLASLAWWGLEANRGGQSAYLRDRGVPMAMRFWVIAAGCWAVVEGLFFGAEHGVRYLLFFVLPPCIYFVVAYSKAEAAPVLWRVVALAVALVALEMGYENFSARVLKEPTWFQWQSYQYVNLRSTRELVQLLYPHYRPTGLIEHVHATATLVSAGAAIAWGLFVSSGRWRWLAVSLVGTAAVVLHGARLPLLACATALAGMHALLYWGLPSLRGALKISALCFLLVVCAILVFDPFGTVAEYYLPALLRFDFQIAGDRHYVKDILAGEARNTFSAFSMSAVDFGSIRFAFPLVLGYGQGRLVHEMGGASDDAFFLQLFAEFGVVGSLVVILVLIASFRFAVNPKSWHSRASAGMLLASAGVIYILLVTAIHSGALQRKAVYPLFFVALGVIHWYRMRRRKPGAS